MDSVKNFLSTYVDKRTVVSVIAAGIVLAGVAFVAKKAGVTSVSKVVAAVK